ncbi:hypothetical protein [Metabacillus indicus]|uniref:hypothetical protein n=1 Tax=Metabacillus indicus TaxID=246786 RepID=UPI000493A9F8|nr:hypothetical protein [Metabacillus indicus]KEZ50769.1 hypothetical protein AZ46_0208980 [Metabacillus indicus LMG 22858]
MNQSKWNDEQITDKLQAMPDIKDRRTQQQIYTSLQQRMHKKKVQWKTPALASFAALFILLILSPFFLQNFQMSESRSEYSADKAAESGQVSEENADMKLEAKSAPEPEKKSFVARTKDNQTIVTVAYPDLQVQNTIPLSFQFDSSDSYMTLFESALTSFDPMSAGLSPSALSGTKLSYETGEERMSVDIKGNAYATSSSETENRLFTEGLEESFRWQDASQADYYTGGEKGAEIGAYGYQDKLTFKKFKKKAYFLYQESLNSPKLLAPSLLSFNKLTDALTAMKEKGTLGLKPVIEETVIIDEIKETENGVTIEFTDASTIDDNETDTLMLEAILMTAKDFGYESVKFEGIEAGKIGEMDVTQAVPVPFSPNPVDLEE